MNHGNTRAFTLIELLIVVAIIAILAAIAVPNFLEAQMRAKVTRAITDMRTVGLGMRMYQLDNNQVPVLPGKFNAKWMVDYMRVDGDRQRRVGELLTTPVAYISEIPFDYFNSRLKVRTPFFIGFRRWSYILSVAPTGHQPAFPNEVEPGFWFIESCGPSLQWDHTPEFFEYDPSNGTVSPGNIAYLSTGRIVPSAYNSR